MLRTSIFLYEENQDSNSPQLLNYKRIKSFIAHVVIKTIVHFFFFFKSLSSWQIKFNNTIQSLKPKKSIQKTQAYITIYNWTRASYLNTTGRWAISLINDDGVSDIFHNNVFKGKIENIACMRLSPCFNPHAIVSASEGAIGH